MSEPPVLDPSDFPTGSWAGRDAVPVSGGTPLWPEAAPVRGDDRSGEFTLPPVGRPRSAVTSVQERTGPGAARAGGWGAAATDGQVPSWRAAVRSNRRVVVRPGPLAVGAAFVGAALVALLVIVYGAVRVDVLWSVLAGVTGLGVFVLTLRGFPLFGALPLALSGFCWGLAMRVWLPASAGDVLGDLTFVGGNLLYVVPLVAAFLLAIALDAQRVSRAAIDEALSGRRWWGDAHRADGEARPAPLRVLEALPAARFFALADGPCPHLVSVGRRVALVLPTAWPDGDYTVDADGRIQRDGTVDPGASADLDGLVGAMDTWHKRLKETGATLRGFLVVAPAGPGARVLLDVASGQHLQLVHGHEFPEAAGGWLATEPYRIDLAVTERLLSLLADPAPDVPPQRLPRQQGRRRAPAAASRSSTPEKLEKSPDPAETANELAPGWDSESSRQLADWASAPPPPETPWWKEQD